MYKTSKEKRVRRHLKLRNKIQGTAARPRLSVSITANNMYVQFIDDDAGVTLASMSTLSEAFKVLNLKRNVEAAKALTSPGLFPSSPSRYIFTRALDLSV